MRRYNRDWKRNSYHCSSNSCNENFSVSFFRIIQQTIKNNSYTSRICTYKNYRVAYKVVSRAEASNTLIYIRQVRGLKASFDGCWRVPRYEGLPSRSSYIKWFPLHRVLMSDRFPLLLKISKRTRLQNWAFQFLCGFNGWYIIWFFFLGVILLLKLHFQ